MGVKSQVNTQSAYIYLVDGSTASTVTIPDVKAKFNRYVDMMAKTAQQLGWEYGDAAFPYVVEEKAEGKDQWFLLKGKDPRSYKYVIVGVGSKEKDGKERQYIQVSLPESATQGDKSKANEYCRFLAKEFKAELHLFNGRVQYFQPRK